MEPSLLNIYGYNSNNNIADQDVDNPTKKAKMSSRPLAVNCQADDPLEEFLTLYNQIFPDDHSDIVVPRLTATAVDNDDNTTEADELAPVYHIQPPTRSPSGGSPQPDVDLIAIAIEVHQIDKFMGVFPPTQSPHKEASDPQGSFLQEDPSPYQSNIQEAPLSYQPNLQEVLSPYQSDQQEAPPPYQCNIQDASSPYQCNIQDSSSPYQDDGIEPSPTPLYAPVTSPIAPAPVAIKEEGHFGSVLKEQQQQHEQQRQQHQYSVPHQHQGVNMMQSSRYMPQYPGYMPQYPDYVHQYRGYMIQQQGQHQGQGQQYQLGGQQHQVYHTQQSTHAHQQLFGTHMQSFQTPPQQQQQQQKQALPSPSSSPVNQASFDFTGQPANPVLPRSTKPKTAVAVMDVQNNPQISVDLGCYGCEVCGKGFSSAASRSSHMRIHQHQGERPYACKFCNKAFKHPGDRLAHMITKVCTRIVGKIRQASDATWECTDCGANHFRSEEKAQRHAQQHDSGRRKMCPVCHLLFPGKRASALLNHVKELHPDYLAELGV